MDSLLHKGFKRNETLDWEHYIEDLSRHKFCISPTGNGVDWGDLPIASGSYGYAAGLSDSHCGIS